MNKKKIAALYGALYYIQSQEEQNRSMRVKEPIDLPSPWAVHGRQTIMQMRGLIQRRVLKR